MSAWLEVSALQITDVVVEVEANSTVRFKSFHEPRDHPAGLLVRYAAGWVACIDENLVAAVSLALAHTPVDRVTYRPLVVRRFRENPTGNVESRRTAGCHG